MKRFTYISAIFFLFAIVLYSQPKLEMEGGNTYDWGEVTPDASPLKATVKITNAGTEKLEITKVKPTCGCTTAPLGKDVLEPNESTTLDITLKVSQSSGNVHKTIRIYSNDPENNGAFTYHLKAQINQPLLVLPRTFMRFKDLTVGYESSASVKLKNTTDKPIKINSFTTKPEELSINLKGEVVIKPQEEIELIATLLPKSAGNLNAKIEFKTDNKKMPDVNINAYGYIKESSLFNSK